MNKAIVILVVILLLGLVIGLFLGMGVGVEGMSNGYVTLNTGVTTSMPSSTGTSSTGTSSTGTTSTPSSTASSSTTQSSTYDGYNHYDNTLPTTFYGPNGGIATIASINGSYVISVTDSTGTTIIYSINGSGSSNAWSPGTNIMMAVANTMFYGPNGGSARVFVGTNGEYALEVTQPNGTTTIYTSTNTYTYTYNQGTGSSPYDTSSSASTSSSYSNGNNYTNYGDDTTGSGAGLNSSGEYNSALPTGIPRSMIPKGQEDLYILKSEIVPPVCPACPTVICPPNKKEKCPACPPCGRCPEPSYDCKLVPNYSASNTYLPTPVLAGFSTFGM